MARQRIGVWFIGAKGGVASTATVGLLALKKGLTQTTALVSELPEFKRLDLVDWKDLYLGGHEIRDIRSRIVFPLLPGTGERRLERVLVSNPRQPPVLANLVGMNGVNDGPAQPARGLPSPGHPYFASSRKAFRYFLAAFVATASARSTSGSYGVKRMPRSVSTARTVSPASRCRRSAMSLGSVALTDPPACRSLTSFVTGSE